MTFFSKNGSLSTSNSYVGPMQMALELLHPWQGDRMKLKIAKLLIGSFLLGVGPFSEVMAAEGPCDRSKLLEWKENAVQIDISDLPKKSLIARKAEFFIEASGKVLAHTRQSFLQNDSNETAHIVCTSPGELPNEDVAKIHGPVILDWDADGLTVSKLWMFSFQQSGGESVIYNHNLQTIKPQAFDSFAKFNPAQVSFVRREGGHFTMVLKRKGENYTKTLFVELESR